MLGQLQARLSEHSVPKCFHTLSPRQSVGRSLSSPLSRSCPIPHRRALARSITCSPPSISAIAERRSRFPSGSNKKCYGGTCTFLHDGSKLCIVECT